MSTEIKAVTHTEKVIAGEVDAVTHLEKVIAKYSGGGGGGGFTPTDAQLAAMNSGIDSTKVQQISTNETNISLKANKQDVYNIGKISANLFDKTKIISGKFYKANGVGETVYTSNNASFYCYSMPVKANTNYTLSRNSYYIYLTDENNVVLYSYGNGQEQTDKTVASGSASKMFVSVNKNLCPADKMMIVEGATLPATYAPYGFVFSDDAENSIKEIAKEANSKIYTVGVGKDYETFTDCIRDLKDDDSPKTIYIDSGIYDIYEEMGGEEFIRSIPDGETDWRNVCDIVPPNTTIIGIGYVEFKYDPEYYTTTSVNLISPLNISSGNITVENIRVVGSNCRYTIHDDGSRDNDSVAHIYKNVVCNKIGGGYSQSFGSGIGQRCSMEFYGCEILSDRIAFSVHNQWYAEFGRLIFENCVISGGTEDVRLSSLSSRDTSYPISVTLRNCKVSTVKYTNEDGVSGRTIPYQVTVCNSGTPTFDDTAFDNNQFPPVIY